MAFEGNNSSIILNRKIKLGPSASRDETKKLFRLKLVSNTTNALLRIMSASYIPSSSARSTNRFVSQQVINLMMREVFSSERR